MNAGPQGPLAGVRVLELGGVGPVPFCAMYLADLGAEVVRIERPLGDDALSRTRARLNLFARSKKSIALDMKTAAGRQVVLDLVARSDIAIEGFRAGALDRLRLGASDCLALKPSLVYGRMSGWGAAESETSGERAAHDINYLAMSGLLSTIGVAAQPVPPLNIVGDFGGALYFAAGLLAALTHVQRGGAGQIVEGSILGGTLGLMTQLYSIHDHGDWIPERQSNWMDGGAPFYRTYETADRLFMAVGAIETQFYRALLQLLGLADEIDYRKQMDRLTWPHTAARFAARFKERSRQEWTALAEHLEACCTPVLSLGEVRDNPTIKAGQHFVAVGNRMEPAPQPSFRATPAGPPAAPRGPGSDAIEILGLIGRDPQSIEALFLNHVVSRP